MTLPVMTYDYQKKDHKDYQNSKNFMIRIRIKRYPDKKRDFNEWLRSNPKEKIKRDDSDRSADRPVRSKHSSISTKTSKRVDEFIKKSPSITSPKEYEAKKNELSVKDNPSSQLMTETLAEILVEQKKYDKAIQAYKILILNNPEKNGFFASRIEKIKQLREKH